MKLKKVLAAVALTMLGALAVNAAAKAQDDPGPAAYAQALKGKRVALVPMAVFDLSQGWAAYLKREVEGWGGTFETRDPNWDTAAAAQAITDLIAADPKPDVLVVHSPDLNSFSKLLKKAQAAGIYVVLVDNPMNFPADAFVGSDWDRLGQLEAEAVVKGCGENSSKKIGLVQGDAANASSIYQYNGIMKVLEKHPDFHVVAKPFSNWDPTTTRNVTATMLQQHPDICGIIDFWDGDAVGTGAAIKDAGLKARCSW
jgi:ribose transport system substrate-binding protein